MIEIGRALTRNARLIIMDEPTSSLSEAETDKLFEICAKLKAKNIAIVYISHKLDEVMHLSDRITVIRDGKNIVTMNKEDTTQEQLIANMIGRELTNMYNKTPTEIGETVLDVVKLSSRNVFHDIEFTVHKGEVVGFFGLVGAGRSEIMRAIFGVDKYDSGMVRMTGQDLPPRHTPASSILNGIAFATEDRKKEGLMLRLSILMNMTIVNLGRLSHYGVMDKKKQLDAAKEFVDELRVKTPSVAQLVGNLSGGNQQKVVLAKWLMVHPQLLIIDEPTRGIDVGSKAEIYSIINELAHQGVAIIVVSSEIEEVMGVSDRVITIYDGRQTADLKVTPELTREEVLACALGGAPKHE
jgi:ABC-type sugar transport system ATPase subunit